MNMNWKIISLFWFLIFCVSCGSHKSSSSSSDASVIKADGKLSDHIDFTENYLLLDTVTDAQINWPEKIYKSPDGTIWISDSRARKLVNFTPEGKWLNTFSKFGQGPGEYLDISDFEITKDGHLYILDGRLDKVMIYDNNGNFSKSLKPPFEADMMHILDNGNILFGISTWDEGHGKEWQIALTDSECNPIKFMIPADEFFDPNTWLGTSGFTITQDGKTVYNREIDDNIYIFNQQGEIESVTRLDFGKYTVQDEDKKNIEGNRNFENYRNIVSKVGMADGNFMGNIWVNGNLAIFSTKDGKAEIQPIDKHLKNIGAIDGCMVLPIMVNDEELNLPDSVRNHLDNEGMALRLLKF